MKKPFSSTEFCLATGVFEMARTNACALQAARHQLTAMQDILKRHPLNQCRRSKVQIERYMADLRAILKAESQVRSFGAAYIRAQSFWFRLLPLRPRRESSKHTDPRPSLKRPPVFEILRGQVSRSRVSRTQAKRRDERFFAIPSAGRSRVSKG